MPTKKQIEFLEKMRRLLTNNAFTNEHISKIQSEGLLNELFIENKNLTLLMHFVKKNDLEKVKYLLHEPNSVQANVLSNINKINALAIAVNEACQNPDYNLAIIDELLQFNPKEQLLQKNKQGLIPLHFAAQSGHMALVQKLLQYHANDQLRVKDEINQDTVSSYAIRSKNYQFITWLFDTYPEALNDVVNDGFTLLHLACRMGDEQLVKIILDRGDKKQLRQTPNASGRIPLIVACTHGYLEIAVELLKINPTKQLSALDKNGHNALHAACLVQSEPFLKLFLQAAKPEYLQGLVNKESIQGYTPIKLALVLSKENTQMLGTVRLLLKAGSTITSDLFESVVQSGNHLMLEELLNHGYNLNEPDQLGKTPLNIAVFFRKSKAVALLLLRGADPNLTIKDNTGKFYSPLLLACYGPDFESIKLLRQHGALMTDNVIQFIIKNHGQKQQLYKQLKDVLPDLPDLIKRSDIVKEKENTPENYVAQGKSSISGRQYLLSQGHSVSDIENMRKPANTMPSWELHIARNTKPEKVVFLDGSIDSDHDAIVPIENSQCYCYLDTLSLQHQGLNTEDLKVSRLRFSPANIKILDKDKGIFHDSIKLSAHYPPEKIQYTHELKINDLDRIFLFQKGPLFIGIKYVPGGVHKQAQIHALHESNRESHAPLEVQWPEGITPGVKIKGMLAASN